MRGPIYEPRGKAREYSPYALNIYRTCNHRCRYCYDRDGKTTAKPTPVPGLADALKKQLTSWAPREQVLLSFIGDPYCDAADDNYATHQCLELLLESHVPVAILTKGGERLMKDIDLIEAFGDQIKVGATLTFAQPRKSLEWEPGAALPTERWDVLRACHDRGIKTFVSIEPVIDPRESMRCISATRTFVDEYKIGKLNHWESIERSIDWAKFVKEAVEYLRWYKKQILVKSALAQYSPIPLTETETDPDKHMLRARSLFDED